MPDKKICLYDSTNQPLTIKGINVELYDASTKNMVAGDLSDDLHPGATPPVWGVVLNFPSGNTPLDLYISDPKYTYPGNMIVNLNGDLPDDVFIDLLALPPGPGGPNSAPPPSLSLKDLNTWIADQREWSSQEQNAVRNLILNFARLVSIEPERYTAAFAELRSNWEAALKRVGVDPDKIEGRPVYATAQ
jgi:hypothetical protein